MTSIFSKLSLSFLLMGASVAAMAQETTSTLSGAVTDTKGSTIAGASVIAIHEPTNYTAGTQTNVKGIFVLPNLKPGGPYTIVISFAGLKADTIGNINLSQLEPRLYVRDEQGYQQRYPKFISV